jgi:hypothetical protein
MNCPRCQHENRSGAKFCEECATPLARTCPNCGGQLSAAAKFCSECTHPVAGASSPEAHFASPQSDTPKHLADTDRGGSLIAWVGSIVHRVHGEGA